MLYVSFFFEILNLITGRIYKGKDPFIVLKAQFHYQSFHLY